MSICSRCCSTALGTILLLGCGGSPQHRAKGSGGDDTASAPPVATLLADDGEVWSETQVPTEGFSMHVEGTAEVDLAGGALSGEVVYTTTSEGEVDCDLHNLFTAHSETGYAAICPDCDFLFAVDDTELEGNSGSSACSQAAYYAYTETGHFTDMGIGFIAEMPEGADYYGGYSDLLVVGYTLDFSEDGLGVYGPYYNVTMGTGPDDSFGQVSFDGESLVWSLDYSMSYGEYYTESTEQYYHDCGSGSSAYGSTTMEGQRYDGSAYYESVDCEGEHADVWGVEATAGQILRVAADTVAAETAFSPALIVNGPDSCSLIRLYDSFPCTYETDEGGCPAATVPIETDGTYSVVVWSFGGCMGDRADYQLLVQLD